MTSVKVAEGELLQQAIQYCLDCHQACDQAVHYCLKKGGVLAQATPVLILMDCAEVCQITANSMLRGTHVFRYLCEVCAEVCDECAEYCEEFVDDPDMRECMEACQRCVFACEEICR